VQRCRVFLKERIFSEIVKSSDIVRVYSNSVQFQSIVSDNYTTSKTCNSAIDRLQCPICLGNSVRSTGPTEAVSTPFAAFERTVELSRQNRLCSTGPTEAVLATEASVPSTSTQQYVPVTRLHHPKVLFTGPFKRPEFLLTGPLQRRNSTCPSKDSAPSTSPLKVLPTVSKHMS
jgi:hypothetical protein